MNAAESPLEEQKGVVKIACKYWYPSPKLGRSLRRSLYSSLGLRMASKQSPPSIAAASAAAAAASPRTTVRHTLLPPPTTARTPPMGGLWYAAESAPLAATGRSGVGVGTTVADGADKVVGADEVVDGVRTAAGVGTTPPPRAAAAASMTRAAMRAVASSRAFATASRRARCDNCCCVTARLEFAPTLPAIEREAAVALPA